MTTNVMGEQRSGAVEHSAFFGSLGSIVFNLIAAWAAFLALLPLSDNSFMTHLATGRLILQEGSVPSSDPYSFTARGTSWTVQSWFPSVALAAAERVAGPIGVRLTVLAVFLIAAGVIWTISRNARSIVIRLLIVASAMVVSVGTWSERPYMVGLIGLGITWLALDRRAAPWILAPYGWLWANSHGSFPLAIIMCAAVILGTLIDRRRFSKQIIDQELKTSGWLVLGLILGVLSPLGSRALTFPIRALADAETFRLIREWQAPDFTSTPQRVFLVLFLVAVASAVRTSRWRHVIPLLVFGGMALLAVRNVVMALPVIVAVISAGVPPVGGLRSNTRPRFGSVLAGLSAVILGVVTAHGLRGDHFDLSGYPTHALSRIDRLDAPGRVLVQDFTGNLLEALDGTGADVFIDDRADMFPKELLLDYVALDRAEVGWQQVLADHDIGVVVWERDAPLSTVLAADPAWQVSFSNPRWIVVERRPY